METSSNTMARALRMVPRVIWVCVAVGAAAQICSMRVVVMKLQLLRPAMVVPEPPPSSDTLASNSSSRDNHTPATIRRSIMQDIWSSSSSSSSPVLRRSGQPLDNSITRQQPQERRRQVLVTGGAGYIGSHTTLELLLAGYRVVVIDNLENSSQESLDRVRQLAINVTQNDADLVFRRVDIRDRGALIKALIEFPDITSCIHFAGKKAVGESVAVPLSYYESNVAGTVTLLQVLEAHNVTNFVFSSSATVYGDPERLPIVETARLQATNPYGRTKLFIEEILRDTHASASLPWNMLILRYFNPIGAHPSGMIGEDPNGVPNNLMPFIAQVSVGRRHHLTVFGNDYDTPDHTGVRDYLHVVDLAQGHVAALRTLYDTKVGCRAVNLGTGHGVSVLELVRGMEVATGTSIPYEIAPRRPGDVATVYADATLARDLLHWSAKLDVQAMCRDTWKWQTMHPYGYNEVVHEQALLRED